MKLFLPRVVLPDWAHGRSGEPDMIREECWYSARFRRLNIPPPLMIIISVSFRPRAAVHGWSRYEFRSGCNQPLSGPSTTASDSPV